MILHEALFLHQPFYSYNELRFHDFSTTSRGLPHESCEQFDDE